MNQELIINNKHYKKADNLESLNMFKGQLYETIVTTQSNENVKNAAPIGVICKDSNHVVIHLDNCVHTHLNIMENGELIVNITKDPLIFTYSTDYNDGIGNVVTCEVEDIYISDYNEIVPLNRAMNAVIESLVYYCRFDHKYKDKQDMIWTHMKELNRVCQKVGNEKEKKSMKLIMEKLKETHDYLE